MTSGYEVPTRSTFPAHSRRARRSRRTPGTAELLAGWSRRARGRLPSAGTARFGLGSVRSTVLSPGVGFGATQTRNAPRIGRSESRSNVTRPTAVVLPARRPVSLVDARMRQGPGVQRFAGRLELGFRGDEHARAGVSGGGRPSVAPAAAASLAACATWARERPPVTPAARRRRATRRSSCRPRGEDRVEDPWEVLLDPQRAGVTTAGGSNWAWPYAQTSRASPWCSTSARSNSAAAATCAGGNSSTKTPSAMRTPRSTGIGVAG